MANQVLAATTLTSEIVIADVGSVSTVSWASNAGYGCVVYCGTDANSSQGMFGVDAASYEAADEAYLAYHGSPMEW